MMKMGEGSYAGVARGGGHGAREDGGEAAAMAGFCRAVGWPARVPQLKLGMCLASQKAGDASNN